MDPWTGPVIGSPLQRTAWGAAGMAPGTSASHAAAALAASRAMSPRTNNLTQPHIAQQQQQSFSQPFDEEMARGRARELLAEFSRHKAHAAELDRQLHASAAENERLQSQVVRLEQQLAAEIAGREAERAAAEKALGESERRTYAAIEDAKQLAASCAAQVGQSAATLKERDAAIAALEAELRRSQDDLATTRAELGEARAASGAAMAEAEAQSLRRRTTEMAGRVMDLERQLLQRDQAAGEAAAHLERQRAQNAMLQAQLAKLEGQARAADDRRMDDTTRMERELHAARHELSEQRALVANLSGQLAAAGTGASGARHFSLVGNSVIFGDGAGGSGGGDDLEAARLRVRLETATNEAATLRRHLDAAHAEATALRKAGANDAAAHAERGAQLQADVQRVQQRLEEERAVARAARDEAQRATAALEVHSQVTETERRALAVAQRTVLDLEEKVKDAADEHRSLQDAVRNLRAEVAARARLEDELRKMIAAARARPAAQAVPMLSKFLRDMADGTATATGLDVDTSATGGLNATPVRPNGGNGSRWDTWTPGTLSRIGGGGGNAMEQRLERLERSAALAEAAAIDELAAKVVRNVAPPLAAALGVPGGAAALAPSSTAFHLHAAQASHGGGDEPSLIMRAARCQRDAEEWKAAFEDSEALRVQLQSQLSEVSDRLVAAQGERNALELRVQLLKGQLDAALRQHGYDRFDAQQRGRAAAGLGLGGTA